MQKGANVMQLLPAIGFVVFWFPVVRFDDGFVTRKRNEVGQAFAGEPLHAVFAD
jgi:hypothetical protein